MSDQGSGPAGGAWQPRREGSVPPPGWGESARQPAEGAPPAPPPGPSRAVADLRGLDARRLGARVIDWLLFLAVWTGLRLAIGPLGWSALLLLLWATVVYFFVCESLTGQTLGKRITGLRVLQRDGSAPSANSIAARNVVRIFEEPIIALLVLVGSRRRRQRVGDLVAGTTVGRAVGSQAPAQSRLLLGYPLLWAVGAVIFGLLVHPQIRVTTSGKYPSGGYPPATSHAGPMTPEWREFAEQVDRACATNFNDGVAQRAAISATARSEHWDRRVEWTAELASFASAQEATYDTIAALGDPPAKPALFARWLANVGRRAELMRRREVAYREKRPLWATEMRITALKLDADRMAQRFGLRICPSNGPGRRMEALAATDPTRAHHIYVKAVNDVCVERNSREDAFQRRGELTTNTTISLSVGESLRMASLAPPPDDYDLRRRILGLKGRLDHEAKEMLHSVATAADQDRAFERLVPRLTRLSDRTQLRLQRLGLLDCGNWGPAPAPSRSGPAAG